MSEPEKLELMSYQESIVRSLVAEARNEKEYKVGVVGASAMRVKDILR